MQIQSIVKKLISWTLIILSFLFLASSITLIGQWNLGAATIGLIFFFFLFALAQRIQAPMNEIRERIKALMNLYLPICPICKSSKGYNITGFWPWLQYAECDNCKAVWASKDFSHYKDLKILRIQTPPKDPNIFARFVSNVPLIIGKNYSIDLWKLVMQDQKVELPITEKKNIIKIIFSDRKRVVLLSASVFLAAFGFYLMTLNYLASCLLLSLGVSLFSSLFGFYFLSIDKNNSYVLFITSFIALFLGLIAVRDTIYKLIFMI